MMPGLRAFRAKHLPIATLYVGGPLISLFVLQAPLYVIAVMSTVLVALVAIAGPALVLPAVAFLSTAVPKAGVSFGGLPLPVMMFALIGIAPLLRAQAKPAGRHGFRLGVLALVWLAYRMAALYVDGGMLRDVAALAGWYGLPLVLLMAGPPLGSLREPMSRTWSRALEGGILFACGFSVVQQLGGIERTAIPGLTRAVGVDYSAKPLLFEGGSKIPSSYQNGNILGVVTALFFVTSAERALRGRGTRRDTVIMAATALATLLSGSRTAVMGLVVAVAVLVLRSGIRRRAIALIGLFGAVIGTALALSPPLGRRLFGTTASDAALAQRTDGWSSVLDSASPLELLTGGSAWAHPLEPPGQVEGLLGAVQQVGIIGMVLFIGMFIVATSPAHLRRWRLLLLPVVVSLAVDSAYLVFPTLFLPIARMFAPLDQGSTVKSRSSAEDAPAGQAAA